MMKKINKKLTSPYKANEKGKSHTDVFVVRAVCMHALSGRKTYKKKFYIQWHNHCYSNKSNQIEIILENMTT